MLPSRKFPSPVLLFLLWKTAIPEYFLPIYGKYGGYRVEETDRGIYTVEGDILPIQIIDSRKLSAEDNLWLRNLDNNLNALETIRLLTEAYRQGKSAKVRTYINVIARANYHVLKEAINMSSTAKSLEDVLMETGITAKAEARAEERKAIEVAKNLIELGIPIETVVSATKLDIEKVKALYKEKAG